MEPRISLLLEALAASATFEDAAVATLRAVIDTASSGLAASQYARRGRILRGMVHLRPGDGYRRLVVEDMLRTDSKAAVPPGPDAVPSCIPSATAWRWVATHRAAVAIDVSLGMVTVDVAGSSPMSTDPEGAPFDSKLSQGRLMGRDVTHVLVLPMRTPGGGIDGMISIEADCRAAIGKGFIWPECRESVRVLAAIAAPYLATLPLRPALVSPPDEFLPIVGASMAGVVQMLRVFARQEETLLLSGATGAGKSRLARWCHEQSPRRGARFETLDLATVPEELQMAELFGWKKGAFTGAAKDTPGCIARAEGGTLFVDEIDKLSLRAQAGLLRVLEERVYRPLGEGAGDRNADVRFIVGTNTNLHQATRAGNFREDLHYRINVLPVRVPPLNERQDEIPRWADYMLSRRHRGSPSAGEAHFTADAHAALARTTWPGNLRQLDNIVRRAYALALTEYDAPPREMTLGVHHVERALALEDGTASRSLVDLLHLTATAFVLEAERRATAGESLDLDHAEALRGFVLGAAAQKLGSLEDAFRLLGKGSTVLNRNHRKVLRAELKRVEALFAALGNHGSALPFAGHLEDGDAGKNDR